MVDPKHLIHPQNTRSVKEPSTSTQQQNTQHVSSQKLRSFSKAFVLLPEWSKASFLLVHPKIKVSQVRILAGFLKFFFFFKFCPNFKGLYLVSAKFRDRGNLYVQSTGSELPLHIDMIQVFLHILSENWLWKSRFYYAKMSKNWSQVRIPDFPSYFWPFVLLIWHS